ncbi:MAG TPA: vitamin K epoxide reductase family protein [Ktedonobacterales bacterium]|nr:vitamin K epoxide reductase family protein [Ktedonobacterales bacterium]
MARSRGADTPPGWRYNPSALSERLPLVALALIGCAIAIYLTLYQLGMVRQVWDPVFGSASSARVTGSALARRLPIPDASLGALGYAADAVLGAIGGPDRWRRLPWLALAFGVVIAGMGCAAVLLVIAQGAILRAWCMLCLCSAAISIVIACAGLGEPLAALQHLRWSQAN